MASVPFSAPAGGSSDSSQRWPSYHSSRCHMSASRSAFKPDACRSREAIRHCHSGRRRRQFVDTPFEHVRCGKGQQVAALGEQVVSQPTGTSDDVLKRLAASSTRGSPSSSTYIFRMSTCAICSRGA